MIDRIKSKKLKIFGKYLKGKVMEKITKAFARKLSTK